MVIQNLLQNSCLGSLSFTILVFIIRIFFTKIFAKSLHQDSNSNFIGFAISPSLLVRQLKQMELSLPIISNIFLTASLSIRWIQSSHFPLSNLFESLLFLTWTITFIHILLLYGTGTKPGNYFSPNIENHSSQFSVILSPFALFTYSFAILNLPQKMQQWTFLLPALQSNWLLMHVSAMMFSYALLLSGSLFSLLILFHERG